MVDLIDCLTDRSIDSYSLVIVLGSFWCHLGIFFLSFSDRLGVVFGSLSGRFGVVLGSSWDRFGVVLGSSWDRFRVVLGSFLGRLGIVFGSSWDRFCIVFASFLHCSGKFFQYIHIYPPLPPNILSSLSWPYRYTIYVMFIHIKTKRTQHLD